MSVQMAAEETMSALCQAGAACLKGDPAFYPGGSFFIDPSGMTSLQLFFSFFVYGYVLFKSADMIGDGAELLLLVPGYADIVGSVVLPILGAIPDGMMVLFSGIGPLAIAQENVAVGVGALAGSTIMLLTLPWILSIYAGLVDTNSTGAVVGYKQKKGKKFTGGTMTGAIEFQDGVTKNSILMFLTSLSYFVIQIPAYFVDNQKTKAEEGAGYLKEVIKESKFENFYALLGLFSTTFFFAFYMYLQYLAAKKKAPSNACLKALLPPPPPPVDAELVAAYGILPLIVHYRDNFLKAGHMRVSAEDQAQPYTELFLGAQESVKGQLTQDLVAPLKTQFNIFAAKCQEDGLHYDDLRQLLSTVGLCYDPADLQKKFEAVDDGDKSLSMKEFLDFFYNLVTSKDPLPYAKSGSNEPSSSTPAPAGGDDDDDEEEDEMPEEVKDLGPAEQQKAIIKSSFQQMMIGTALVLVFTDPMVDVLSQIGVNTGIPTFYVSFVLAPLASNASELTASMKLAAKKTSTSITQSLQTLEGAACMNNTFCLGIFFFLIYYQGLAWKFYAETLSIFLVQFLVFVIVQMSHKQTMLHGIGIFLFYPVSLVFVAGLESMGFD